VLSHPEFLFFFIPAIRDGEISFQCEYVGLEKESSLEDSVLQKAYSRRTLRSHPDKPGGSKESFQQLQGKAACFSHSGWLRQQRKESRERPAGAGGDGAASEEDDATASDCDDFYADVFWQDWFSSFFRFHANGDDGTYEQFSTAYERTDKERAQQWQVRRQPYLSAVDVPV